MIPVAPVSVSPALTFKHQAERRTGTGLDQVGEPGCWWGPPMFLEISEVLKMVKLGILSTWDCNSCKGQNSQPRFQIISYGPE